MTNGEAGEGVSWDRRAGGQAGSHNHGQPSMGGKHAWLGGGGGFPCRLEKLSQPKTAAEKAVPRPALPKPLKEKRKRLPATQSWQAGQMPMWGRGEHCT